MSAPENRICGSPRARRVEYYDKAEIVKGLWHKRKILQNEGDFSFSEIFQPLVHDSRLQAVDAHGFQKSFGFLEFRTGPFPDSPRSSLHGWKTMASTWKSWPKSFSGCFHRAARIRDCSSGGFPVFRTPESAEP